MDDIQKWRRLALEQQALREKAEESMLATRATLQQERALRRREQALREQEEARWNQERARREEIEREILVLRTLREEEAKRRRPQTLLSYLESYHSFTLAIQVETGLSKEKESEPTGPVGQLYPRRIIPWHDFAARQEDTWKQLADPSFTMEHEFPSQDKCRIYQSQIQPISCEVLLREFGKEAIERAVRKLIDAVNSNPLLRDRLGLRGKALFYTHPTRDVDNQDESESNDHAYCSGWYCNYLTSDGTEIAKTVIDYRLPQELTQDVVLEGLVSEIQPARDVIGKKGGDVASASRARATAVVTQLFSCMIDKGIQYGYVCTGQTYIFLHIPDDPSIVYYHVSVPSLDVRDDGEARLYQTAVAKVFAFILQSFLVEPPPQSWHDAAANLSVWPGEYADTQSVCEGKESRASGQESQRQLLRSPIRTRSCSKRLNIESNGTDGNVDETALFSSTIKEVEPPLQHGGVERKRIQDCPYCTQACLMGLAYGGPMDKSCPNAVSHGPRHISKVKFLRLLRAQLAKDRGPDTDIIPLHLSGAIGALFKVRLSAYGYTLVAKGMVRTRLERLEHERDVYDVLRPIQGKHVAVCLGLMDLILPYYYHGRVFANLLFLSWAGRPLYHCVKEVSEKTLISAVTIAFKSLHRLGVLHTDAEIRNITYDQAPMIVDFERAKIVKSDSLGTADRDSHGRKRKSETVQQQEAELFAEELRSVVYRVSSRY
ncbi:hypothetical protein SEPCBS119000_006630 [Sporothrix epigloea]|uniref:Protein kinase domain-containing protein n=1 Tax=Sporothrix epigloea TaxID=1892477 RepID=A0ABP0E412_9PEZI